MATFAKVDQGLETLERALLLSPTSATNIMDIMKRSGHVRCRSRGALVAALCAALACIPDVAGAQDDREGFYAGLHLGVALPTGSRPSNSLWIGSSARWSASLPSG